MFNFIVTKRVAVLLLFFVVSHAFPDEKLSVRFIHSFPEAGEKLTGLSTPQALAINQEGEVFVVDSGNSRIIKFDKTGKYLLAVGGFGWESEQFDRPVDITAKTGLDLFIADYNNERIERYDNNLNYISSLYSDEAQPEELRFGFPASVDISKHGELFICDNENNRILKLGVDGKPLVSFGGYNWGQGQVVEPTRLEIDSNDRIFVTDRTSDAIYIFDYYGNFMTKIGEKIVKQPAGLAVSDDGLLYVCDTGHDRVVVFNNSLRKIFAWGRGGDGMGAFKEPLDVATYNNRIYVLDSANNRVQVFELYQTIQ